jgi:hypothetical protein
MSIFEGEEQRHPAFGLVRFSRIQGGCPVFYGSELEQNHYIQMEVSESYVRRELTRDWYSDGPIVVRLRMTSGQFSELITTLNYGVGVPCTLEFRDGKKVESLVNQDSRKDVVHKEFKNRMKMFADTIREKKDSAKTIVKKKILSKADIHDLSHLLDWLITEVESNIPFFAECFQETMDTVVNEAKMEVENAIQHKLTTLGLDSLKMELKMIDDKTKTTTNEKEN